MWRVLRPVIGSKKTPSPISITADAPNNYYVSVAPNLTSSVPAPTETVHTRLPMVNTGGLKVQPITMETLWTIVQGMKSSSFEGADGLSVRMVQKNPGFGHILLDLVNTSLETGRVPPAWKQGCASAKNQDPRSTKIPRNAKGSGSRIPKIPHNPKLQDPRSQDPMQKQNFEIQDLQDPTQNHNFRTQDPA